MSETPTQIASRKTGEDECFFVGINLASTLPYILYGGLVGTELADTINNAPLHKLMLSSPSYMKLVEAYEGDRKEGV